MLFDRGEYRHEDASGQQEWHASSPEKTPTPITDAQARAELKARNFELTDEERAVLLKTRDKRRFPKGFLTPQESAILSRMPPYAHNLLLSREERRSRRGKELEKDESRQNPATTRAFEKARHNRTTLTPEDRALMRETPTNYRGIDWFTDDNLPGSDWVYDESHTMFERRIENKRPLDAPMTAAQKEAVDAEAQEFKKEMAYTLFKRAMDNGLLRIAFDKLNEMYENDAMPEEVCEKLRQEFVDTLESLIIKTNDTVADKIRAQTYRNELIAMRDAVAQTNFAGELRITMRDMTPEEIDTRRTQNEQTFAQAIAAKDIDTAFSALGYAKAYGSSDFPDMRDELVWDIEAKLQQDDTQLNKEERTRLEELLARARAL